MSDDEIRELERRVAEGDLTAWPALDATLERAGLRPKRVWIVWQRGGEYSDAWENIQAIKYSKRDAMACMTKVAEDANAQPELGWAGPLLWKIDPADPERWLLMRADGYRYQEQEMYMTWEWVK